jgi:Fic family protein
MAATKRSGSDAGRTYSRTHPWINFRFDLVRAPYKLWMTIGEARSRCEHIAGIPLRPGTAEQLDVVYLSKGVHATTSIEGNTLSEEQVKQQVERTLKLPGSQQYLQHEVQNIIDACREIAGELERNPEAPLTPERIAHFNALVLRGLPRDEDVMPGKIRTHSVGVMEYRGAPWQDGEYLVGRLCDWLNGDDFRPGDPDLRFALVLLRAILAHLYLAWIHPFGDGNGRTARLVEFQLLAQSGLVPFPAAHLLSNHYNKTRSRYYAELSRSSKVEDGPMRFFAYAVEGFVDGLGEQLSFIREQQLQVTWENYVHEQFHGKHSPAFERRKQLVLDMPPEFTPRGRLPNVSARVTRAYASVGDQTLSRDLESLGRMKLVVRSGSSWRPNRDLILAFLPRRSPESEPRT